MTKIDEQSAVTALAALAQTSRLSVFRLLVSAAPTGALPSEIAAQLEIPANTLSFHLKALLHADLASMEQQGRNVRYRANLEHMQQLLGYLTENCCSGDISQCAPAFGPAKPKRKKASC